jgi:ribosomal protein S12 methylthiotransferase
MPERRLHVVALGCPKNRVDVESVVALAEREGFALTDDAAAADVILVATCGFVTEASQESIATTLELAGRRRPGARLVVAGCLSQRYGEELARALPEADYFVGTADMTRVADAVAGRGPRVAIGDAASDLATHAGRRPSGRPGSAYLKVADGCSRRCAFCTIPAIRGPFRSRPVDELCDEARDLARAGAIELNLVAQDLTAFGRDRPGEAGLADLLAALGRVDGIRWIRPLYLYPERGLRRVLAEMARNPRVVKYLDLPIQHASDAVLRRMKRGHRAALVGALLDDARRIVPGVSLRTTVIVGHPGEDEVAFDELIALVQRVRFEHLGAFRFSPEDGTSSATQAGAAPRRVAYARYRRVMAVQRRISRRTCRALRGRVVEVLVEGRSEDSPLVYVGRHAGQAPEVDGVVYLDRPAEPGRMVAVRITGSGDYDLSGEVIEP